MKSLLVELLLPAVRASLPELITLRYPLRRGGGLVISIFFPFHTYYRLPIQTAIVAIHRIIQQYAPSSTTSTSGRRAWPSSPRLRRVYRTCPPTQPGSPLHLSKHSLRRVYRTCPPTQPQTPLHLSKHRCNHFRIRKNYIFFHIL